MGKGLISEPHLLSYLGFFSRKRKKKIISNFIECLFWKLLHERRMVNYTIVSNPEFRLSCFQHSPRDCLNDWKGGSFIYINVILLGLHLLTMWPSSTLVPFTIKGIYFKIYSIWILSRLYKKHLKQHLATNHHLIDTDLYTGILFYKLYWCIKPIRRELRTDP